MATNKPTSFIWATGSNLADPGNAKKAAGWQVNEAPPSTEFNWLQNHFTTFLDHINTHGVPAWDGQTEYADGALTYHNGIVWSRASAGSGGTPGVNAAWSPAYAATLTSNMTINVPTDFPTLQAAFESIRGVSPNGKTVTLNIESGHSPASGIVCENGNFGFIRIDSDNNEVTLSGSFPATTDFIRATNCHAPELHTTINMADRGRHGLWLDKSTGFILNSKGIKNAGSNGAELVKTSRLVAPFSDFSGAGDFGVRIRDASVADINNCNCDNSGNVGIECNEASSINASAATARNAGSVGIQASGGRITAPNSDASGAAGDDYAVINGGILSAAGGTGTANVTANAVTAGGIYLA